MHKSIPTNPPVQSHNHSSRQYSRVVQETRLELHVVRRPLLSLLPFQLRFPKYFKSHSSQHTPLIVTNL